ncbi:MAG: hypothetical protein COS71_02160 [Candidatus Moranbacteria bacterium CG06_land_8_20_14_3_00_40_12]|nr:MAG: hypothetical protein COX31_01340 [Candidatus Moranbacteria bacterium CG23_combo_of_CG06-09_8_20_14_all_40_16]PIU80681.1 MAG: hypothetical protein COS71_02160 [Candidatus Moranbacteria bacterium CG06_land_8_20_14_3_00_40_12]
MGIFNGLKINNKIIAVSLAVFAFFRAGSVQAFCPVCTLAVGAGVGLSRYLGIDDTISGLWIGGLTVSMIMWTLNWLDKKNIHFKGQKIITILSFYLLIVAPLYWTGILGHPLNMLWGMDRLLLGILAGSLVFWGTGWWYFRLKARNEGRAHFPFQKVAMPVGALLIFSLIFYFLIR